MSRFPRHDWRYDEDQSKLAAMVAGGERNPSQTEPMRTGHVPDTFFHSCLNKYLDAVDAKIPFYGVMSVRLLVGTTEFAVYEDACSRRSPIAVSEHGDVCDGSFDEINEWMHYVAS